MLNEQWIVLGGKEKNSREGRPTNLLLDPPQVCRFYSYCISVWCTNNNWPLICLWHAVVDAAVDDDVDG